MHKNRNPCNSFLMIKMASGMDHGRVRLATTTSYNMAAIQQVYIVKQSIYLFDIRHPYYVSVSRDYSAGSGLELINVACFFEVDR